MPVEFQLYPETVVEGKRLGSHFHKDSRSRDHAIAEVVSGYQTDPTLLTSKTWRRHTAVLDQGQVGSCTGNACTGMLGSEPLYESPEIKAITVSHRLNEHFALNLYEEATRVDGLGAPYPPNDRGSSTLGVLKAAKTLGYIGSYKWAFGLVDALNALSLQGAVIVGVLWYEGFDNPQPDGELQISGSVRGGHELELNGIDVPNKRVWGYNSWGKTWDESGKFWWSWDTLGTLLSEQGECGMGFA